MSLLSRKQILERLGEKGTRALHIDPLLEQSQIGEVSIDLRMGYDFLVSMLTRSPYLQIDAAAHGYKNVKSFFHLTRKDIGQKFILYPGQVVLSCTLEYVSLPRDVYADIITRSSYNRLGIHLNTMVQPGFRGCIGLELLNHGTTPIELIVGSRVVQARLIELTEETDYFAQHGQRKYIGDVRPIYSKAQLDKEIARLRAMSND